MFRVKKFFTDLQDNGYAYKVGDEFPHEGHTVSPKRLAELSGSKNKRGIPLIEEIIDEPLPFTEDDPEPKAEKPQEKPKAKRGKRKG